MLHQAIKVATNLRGSGRSAPAAPPPELGVGPHFPDIIDWWFRIQAPRLAESTQRERRSTLGQASRHLPPHPETCDFETYFAGLRRRGMAVSTINKQLHALRAVYRSAIVDQVAVTDPTSRIRDFPVRELRPRALVEPRRTFPQLVAACPDTRARFLLLVQRYQGLRISEALGIEPADVDLQGQRLHVHQARSGRCVAASPLKGRGQIGRLPLHPLVAAAYRDLLRNPPHRHTRGEAARRYLLPYFDHELEDLLDHLRAVVPGAFPDGAGWHALRHTYASELLEAGTRVEVIMRLLRHSSLQATEVYLARLRGRAQVEAAELVQVEARETEERAAVSRYLPVDHPPKVGVYRWSDLSTDHREFLGQTLGFAGRESMETTGTPRGGLDASPAPSAIHERQVPVARPGPEPTSIDGARVGDRSRSRGRAEPQAPASDNYSIDVGWTDRSVSTSSTLSLPFPPWSVTPPPRPVVLFGRRERAPALPAPRATRRTRPAPGGNMRTPDFAGSLGRMWRVPIPTVLEKPDHSATLAQWLLGVPSAHPAWHGYALAVVHLRDIPGVRPAHRRYPEAEYEVMLWALDPAKPLDPDEQPFRPAVLTPANLVEQFHGVTDAQAVLIVEQLGRSFVDGINSPDTDWRAHTVESLRRTVQHHALGGHPLEGT